MFGRSGQQRSPGGSGSGADQMLLDLVNGLRGVEERVEALERRFEALGTVTEPDDDSLMETRLHVARLSAELSRLTVELRGKIVELGNRTGVVFDDDTSSLELADDESFEDLTADSPARAPTVSRSSGWQPST
jgi:hypothetical protein